MLWRNRRTSEEEQQVKTSKYRHPGVVAIYFCVLVLSTSIRLAYAQTSDQGWTLEQMLERALETSPDVHEALADELVSASQLGRAKAGRLPTASFTGIISPITAA